MPAQSECNIVTYCDILHVIILYFAIKYLLDATFRSSLAFQMSVLEMLEKSEL